MQDWPRIAQSALERIPTDTLLTMSFLNWNTGAPRESVLSFSVTLLMQYPQLLDKAPAKPLKTVSPWLRLFLAFPPRFLDDALDFWREETTGPRWSGHCSYSSTQQY